MTSTAKARAGETPAARQKRVWDKAAPSYDKQIAFFEKIQAQEKKLDLHEAIESVLAA